MLLVYGPRSTDYDFGEDHPLTPRRFGPSIDLLRAVGAVPGLAPEPAPDEELLWCHRQAYIDTVRRFSLDAVRPGCGRDRRGRGRPGVRRDARGRRCGRRRLAACHRGCPPRGPRARLPSGRWSPSRDAGPGVRVLHLRRSGARHRAGTARGAARALPGHRRPPRRRRPVDPLGGSGRPDAVRPRVRPVPVPGHWRSGRDRSGSGGGDVSERAPRAVQRGGPVARGHSCAGAGAGGGLRSGPHRVAAWRRLARLGSAGTSARHDDRDG